MVFSNYKQEIVAELNNSQPQCTTTVLIVCKSIHFDDDTRGVGTGTAGKAFAGPKIKGKSKGLSFKR